MKQGVRHLSANLRLAGDEGCIVNTLDIQHPGNDLVAGVNVALKGWGGYDGKYIIKQAVHKLDGSGYTTQISLRMVLEGY